MTYKNFCKLVMQHLDQYSVAGTVIPESYNNHIDSTNRICALANIALRTIATQTVCLTEIVQPLSKSVKREELPGGYTKITMPENFFKMTGRGIPTMDNNSDYARNMNYQYFAPNQLVVKTEILKNIVIPYHRYPATLHGMPDEILDGTEMMADCASFYVAAQLARYENAYAYQSLYNEFETMMARLKPPIITEFAEVQDVYGFY